MLIYWNGHSEFLLESAGGYRVLTDPFDDHVGYPMKSVRTDAVVVSHGHGDHSYTSKVDGKPMILDRPGNTRLTPDVMISAVMADHDDAHGSEDQIIVAGRNHVHADVCDIEETREHSRRHTD